MIGKSILFPTTWALPVAFARWFAPGTGILPITSPLELPRVFLALPTILYIAKRYKEEGRELTEFTLVCGSKKLIRKRVEDARPG